ncbi:CBO0543 family protein [Ammoniphilus sp. 3BR4]|uniref:CBO0543 family protein n=1 Tax=Ammoniphilus sp. 3BR4 TaxID=3158265 RepID=UPI00346705AE
MLIIPLVVLYFLLDRRKAFLLGFLGFNVHVWFTYIDAYGIKQALWNYPFQITHVLPTGFALDASLIPVSYMLVYQWTLNQNKNYYIYTTILCISFAFIMKSLMVAFDLFQMYKGTNYFHLFIGYITIMLLSKWITNVFIHFQQEQKEISDDKFNFLERFRKRAKAK